jgi:hypothetical protein
MKNKKTLEAKLMKNKKTLEAKLFKHASLKKRIKVIIFAIKLILKLNLILAGSIFYKQ